MTLTWLEYYALDVWLMCDGTREKKVLQNNSMLKDTQMSRKQMGAFRSIHTCHPPRLCFRFSSARNIRLTCHTLRLAVVQGNRQAPHERIVSCSGTLRHQRMVSTYTQEPLVSCLTLPDWEPKQKWDMSSSEKCFSRMMHHWGYSHNGIPAATNGQTLPCL